VSFSFNQAVGGSPFTHARGASFRPHEGGGDHRGSAINYPGNPLFRPSIAFKMSASTEDMIQREDMLLKHALLIKEEGLLGIHSCEELKEVILHHFSIRKQEMYVYRNSCTPFVVVFSGKHARDEVYAVGRVIDEGIELCFIAWELDEFAEPSIILYHVKLSIEGIPHHAWNQEVVEKVLCDEAIIHHVKEGTGKKIDVRTFPCWAFSKDPSKIPQIVFLSLINKEMDCFRESQVHFVRPRGVRQACVFKILIHTDVVEDLLFYHHPQEEPIADGKSLGESLSGSWVILIENLSMKKIVRTLLQDSIARVRRCGGVIDMTKMVIMITRGHRLETS
jgi:hypothetical protein